ncbi:MAG: TVP38/TMEM64 family protein [Candidatus Sumerlaeaceae bacterium]
MHECWQTPEISRSRVAAHLVLGLIILASVAWTINVLGRHFIEIDRLREWVRGFGPAAPLVFIAVFTAAHLVFLPVAPFVVAAIAAFHWPVAIATILVSHNLAANLGYALPSIVGKERMHRIWQRHPKLAEFDRKICERGFVTVLALRIVPALPFSVVSYVSALSCIRWRDYALASFVGFLPGSIVMAFVLSHGTS